MNLVEGGTLSVFKDALQELADHYSGRYEVVALSIAEICLTSMASPTSNSRTSSLHGSGASTSSIGVCALSAGDFDPIFGFPCKI